MSLFCFQCIPVPSFLFFAWCISFDAHKYLSCFQDTSLFVLFLAHSCSALLVLCLVHFFLMHTDICPVFGALLCPVYDTLQCLSCLQSTVSIFSALFFCPIFNMQNCHVFSALLHLSCLWCTFMFIPFPMYLSLCDLFCALLCLSFFWHTSMLVLLSHFPFQRRQDTHFCSCDHFQYPWNLGSHIPISKWCLFHLSPMLFSMCF